MLVSYTVKDIMPVEASSVQRSFIEDYQRVKTEMGYLATQPFYSLDGLALSPLEVIDLAILPVKAIF